MKETRVIVVSIPKEFSGKMTPDQAEKMRPLIDDYFRNTERGKQAVLNMLAGTFFVLDDFEVGDLWNKHYEGILTGVPLRVTGTYYREESERYGAAVQAHGRRGRF